jgi:dihydrolipoamide dehydrogenase
VASSDAQTVETEVLVIGGGPGGYAAAFHAADLGLEVTLVSDETELGGVCLLRGCIPSKTLLSAAELVLRAGEAAESGLRFGEPDIDLDRLRTWKNEVVGQLTAGLSTLADRRGLKLIEGRARFSTANEVQLDGERPSVIRFQHAIIATGSHPLSLPDVEFGGRLMDSARALEIPDVPRRLLVVGGGYVGLEMGTVYAALGSEVTLVEMTDGLMPRADRDLVRPLARHLEKLFAAVHLETKVTRLNVSDEDVEVELDGNVEETEQSFERALLAIGRAPNSEDLGLENTDVELNNDGCIVVDSQRRTAEDSIFAIGDVAGGEMLAHKAMHEGRVAAEVIAGQPAEYDVRAVPAVVYTDPQVAWCGMSESDAERTDLAVDIVRYPWKASGRAVSLGATDGMTKLVIDAETRRILGVGIVGRHAENLIAEGALAVEMGAVAQDLELTQHPHPTLSETLGEAAQLALGGATHLGKRRK